MLKSKKDGTYEIDREITGKLAIESNAELQDKVEKLEKENKKLKTRIDTMQEFIDYSEGVVNNAIQMLYEEGGQEKALDYLENCYAVGDDRQYEEMEKLDDDLEI